MAVRAQETREHPTQSRRWLGFGRNGDLLAVAALLFLAPNALFAADLNWPAASIVGAGSILSGYLLIKFRPAKPGSWSAQSIDLKDLALSIAVGLALVVLGGEGHLLFTNSDWLTRDAVLADLTRSPGLPRYLIGDEVYVLRAPLGMYMSPALVGRIFGLAVSHIAMVAQNALILGVILYGFRAQFSRRRTIGLAVMLGSSGIVLVAALMIRWQLGLPINLNGLPSHLDSWSKNWQYSSLVTQIFWVPNHALPGWWAALLAVLSAGEEVSLGWFGLSLATVVFWSPLAVLGALPFTLLRFARRPIESLSDKGFWLQFAASLLFLPEALYMLGHGEAISQKLMLNQGSFFGLYCQFIIISLIPASLILFFIGRFPSNMKSTIVLSFVTLLILPLFWFGSDNDLVMRGSILPLVVMAYAFSEAISWGPSARPMVWITAVALWMVGMASPLSEMTRAFEFHRFNISNCGFVSAQLAMSFGPISPNYLSLADGEPTWILSRDDRQVMSQSIADCWPDFPFDPTLFVGYYSNKQLKEMK